MRRFSQRNSLVTLNEINITPLLDLAFVLLIIFVITRPLLEQSIDMNLPKGGAAKVQVEARDIQTVEITGRGEYKLNGRFGRLDQIINALRIASQNNADTVIAIRADENGAYKHVAAVVDACSRNGLTRFSLKTFPEK